MKNEAKKLTETTTAHEQKAVLQIVKSEPKPQEEKTQVPTIGEVLKKVTDQFNLAEQHANFTNQINKLNNFRSRINTNSSLMLTNGSGEQFTSNDPAAVETLIDICIGNIQDRINGIESKLLAA